MQEIKDVLDLVTVFRQASFYSTLKDMGCDFTPVASYRDNVIGERYGVWVNVPDASSVPRVKCIISEEDALSYDVHVHAEGTDDMSVFYAKLDVA